MSDLRATGHRQPLTHQMCVIVLSHPCERQPLETLQKLAQSVDLLILICNQTDLASCIYLCAIAKLLLYYLSS